MYPWILAQVPSPTTEATPGAPALVAPVAPAGTAPALPVQGGVAATTVAGTQASGTQPDAKAPPDNSWFIWILPLGVLAFYLMTRGKGKEDKKRKALLESMKKGDEVETIGGLVGKIVEVKDGKVVIKIDESANVKATYLKGAIARVITQEDKDKADKADDKK